MQRFYYKSLKDLFQKFFYVASHEDIPLFFFFQMHFFCPSSAKLHVVQISKMFTAPITTVIIHNILLIVFMYFRYLQVL